MIPTDKTSLKDFISPGNNNKPKTEREFIIALKTVMKDKRLSLLGLARVYDLDPDKLRAELKGLQPLGHETLDALGYYRGICKK